MLVRLCQSSSTYHWHVTIWDKDDKSVVSDAATFEMGLLEENAFDDVHWIRMPKAGDPDPDAPEQVADTSVYTIESNFKFNDAVGFVFAGTDKTHFYMWQLNNNMENGVKALISDLMFGMAAAHCLILKMLAILMVTN